MQCSAQCHLSRRGPAACHGRDDPGGSGIRYSTLPEDCLKKQRCAWISSYRQEWLQKVAAQLPWPRVAPTSCPGGLLPILLRGYRQFSWEAIARAGRPGDHPEALNVALNLFAWWVLLMGALGWRAMTCAAVGGGLYADACHGAGCGLLHNQRPSQGLLPSGQPWRSHGSGNAEPWDWPSLALLKHKGMRDFTLVMQGSLPARLCFLRGAAVS